MAYTLSIDKTVNPWIKDYSESKNQHYLNVLLNIGFTVSQQISIRSNDQETEKLLDIQHKKIEDYLTTTVEQMKDTICLTLNRVETIEQRSHNALENSQDKMIQFVENFTGKTKTSSIKGEIAENYIENVLENEFPEDTIHRSSGIAHEADIQLHSTYYPSISFESKNYSHSVPYKEIDKFKQDLIRTNIMYGIFISFHSKISGKKNMEIECFDNKYYILYISKIDYNANWIIMATNLIRNISKLNTTDKTKSISKQIVKDKIHIIAKQLTKLNSLVSCLTKTKANLIQQENNIRNALDNIHTSYICNEAEINRIIDEIQNEINLTITDVEIDKLSKISSNIDNLLLNINPKKIEHSRAIFTQIILAGFFIEFNAESNIFNVINDNKKIVSEISIKDKIKLFIKQLDTEIDLTKKSSLSNIKTYLSLLTNL